MSEKAVLVIFNDHNETFKTLHQAAESLDIADHLLFDAINKGHRVNTAAGPVFADWLEEN